MRLPTGLEVKGIYLFVSLLGFALFVLWRFLAHGFFDALGGAFIYMICWFVVTFVIDKVIPDD